MHSYAAFLRGVNVGGHNLINMKEMCLKFQSMGFENVSSYRASGNILFQSSKSDEDSIARSMGKKVSEMTTGREVEVLLRSHEELLTLIGLNPFKGKNQEGTNKKNYVSFTTEMSRKKPSHPLPLFSAREDVEIVLLNDRNVFCLSHLVQGRFGFPNAFVEKTFGTKATTRDWKTVTGVTSILDEKQKWKPS